jgi:hypothetical protein
VADAAEESLVGAEPRLCARPRPATANDIPTPQATLNKTDVLLLIVHPPFAGFSFQAINLGRHERLRAEGVPEMPFFRGK